MNNVIEATQAVREFAACALKDTIVVEGLANGEGGRQGDIYIVRIEAPNREWKETKNRQLAIGTTAGSQHTVDESVKVLQNPQNGVVLKASGLSKAVCLGPQLCSEDRFTVSHPEHADVSLPAGTYEVSFQMDPSTQQRVQE